MNKSSINQSIKQHAEQLKSNQSINRPSNRPLSGITNVLTACFGNRSPTLWMDGEAGDDFFAVERRRGCCCCCESTAPPPAVIVDSSSSDTSISSCFSNLFLIRKSTPASTMAMQAAAGAAHASRDMTQYPYSCNQRSWGKQLSQSIKRGRSGLIWIILAIAGLANLPRLALIKFHFLMGKKQLMWFSAFARSIPASSDTTRTRAAAAATASHLLPAPDKTPVTASSTTDNYASPTAFHKNRKRETKNINFMWAACKETGLDSILVEWTSTLRSNDWLIGRPNLKHKVNQSTIKHPLQY